NWFPWLRKGGPEPAPSGKKALRSGRHAADPLRNRSGPAVQDVGSPHRVIGTDAELRDHRDAHASLFVVRHGGVLVAGLFEGSHRQSKRILVVCDALRAELRSESRLAGLRRAP